MNASVPIKIIGGGLAGLTLGIALRQRGVPVELSEAGDYPRHRVCGEFISGQGQETLKRLGLMPLITRAGARLAETAVFYSGRTHTPIRGLPQPAVCISRWSLDALLAEEFCRVGGELKVGTRWREKRIEAGVVRAMGRRAQSRVEGWRWLGLKAHAQKVSLSADLEMHVRPNGYIGLCRLPGGVVNVCGLFRVRGSVPETPHLRPDFLLGEGGTILAERLREAEFDPASVCSVAGLNYHSTLQKAEEVSVGDSWGLIPPVTGNGMSMAFESAEIAASVLEQYAFGMISWEKACHEVKLKSRQRFQRRLTIAEFFQRTLFTRGGPASLVWLSSKSAWCWRLFFGLTR